VKTGRMAPVKGQLTDGALTPSGGMCAHANVHTLKQLPRSKKTQHREVLMCKKLTPTRNPRWKKLLKVFKKYNITRGRPLLT